MKIALIGYGKMGRMIEGIALNRGHEVVCKIDIDNQQDFESEAFRTADVAIEFTAPSVAWGNVQRCFAAGVPWWSFILYLHIPLPAISSPSTSLRLLPTVTSPTTYSRC